MSSVEGLREFVSERLTAAAEEIFQVFQRTIVEYEEEILRQRKLLDIVWKPHVKLQRIDVSPELKGDLDDQQLCNQERDLSLDQDRAEIKEEPGQSCISHEGEQLLPKPQTDMVNFNEESDKMLLFLNSDVTENQGPFEGQHEDKGTITDLKSEQKTEYELNVHHSSSENKPQFPDSDCNTRTRKKSFRGDPCGKRFNSRSGLQRHMTVHKETDIHAYQQLCNNQRTSSPDQEDPEPAERIEEKESVGTSQEGEQLVLMQQTDTSKWSLTYEESMHSYIEPEQQQRPLESYTTNVFFPLMSSSNSMNPTNMKSFICGECGKGYTSKSSLYVHQKIHTGEKPYSCITCGKRFCRLQDMQRHEKIHTGEKPFTCETCGKDFLLKCQLQNHMKVHATEKPYPCHICGKKFCRIPDLKRHFRTHTGEKPFTCATCGRGFNVKRDLIAHMRKGHPADMPHLFQNTGMHLSWQSMQQNIQ